MARSLISPEIVAKEFETMFKDGRYALGKLINKGVCRHVYECKSNSDIVIKIEPYAKDFQNVKEWAAWEQFKNNPLVADRLAPCIEISPCGVVLIQRKCEKVETFPDQLPAFMASDPSHQNFGLLDGKVVLLDYGQFEFIAYHDYVQPKYFTQVV